MATPQLRIANFSLPIIRGNPFAFRVNTFNADGTVLDVSTGYTLETARAYPSSSLNPQFNFGGGTDLSTLMSAVFDETGFTVTGTAGNANSIIVALSTLTSQLQLGISDDAGTTISVVALGTVTLPQILGAGT